MNDRITTVSLFWHKIVCGTDEIFVSSCRENAYDEKTMHELKNFHQNNSHFNSIFPQKCLKYSRVVYVINYKFFCRWIWNSIRGAGIILCPKGRILKFLWEKSLWGPHELLVPSLGERTSRRGSLSCAFFEIACLLQSFTEPAFNLSLGNGISTLLNLQSLRIQHCSWQVLQCSCYWWNGKGRPQTSVCRLG